MEIALFILISIIGLFVSFIMGARYGFSKGGRYVLEEWKKFDDLTYGGSNDVDSDANNDIYKY